MSRADVEQIALKLSETDRALLAAVLLESVAPDCLAHSNEETERRERELDESKVSEISREELLRRVEAERRR
ncbi:MAG TPA: addiction module antitoxin RelB [Verrucomicrobiae bacterium]|nr:addiction module antitoxin RelB [Verrucomicrobiae bacterium]